MVGHTQGHYRILEKLCGAWASCTKPRTTALAEEASVRPTNRDSGLSSWAWFAGKPEINLLDIKGKGTNVTATSGYSVSFVSGGRNAREDNFSSGRAS